MITLKNISKKYSEKNIINNINLTLPKGKVIAFIGSNGAGKSTLLSIISRTISKDSGQVFINEKEISDWDNSELSKTISILKQSNELNIRLTVRELVSFGRFPYSKGKLTKEDIDKINESLEYMGLTHIQDRYLDELSGGQRQMAFICMVVCQDTEYVLLDEPLNNLDMKHSVIIMKNIKKLVSELGKTAIIVIHDINFVSCYADYIVAMKEGEIIKSGKTDEIIKSSILKEIYNMDIDVRHIKDKNICLYYL